MTGLTTAECSLLTVTTEGMLYGVSIVLSAEALYLLLWRDRSQGVMAVGAIVFLILTTLHMIFDLQYYRMGFALSDAASKVYFARISTPMKIAEATVRIAGVSIADALQVWRLWRVWHRDKLVIIFPSLTCLATAACGIAFVVDQSILRFVPSVTVFTKPVLDWTIAFLACSLATTLFCTAFIAYQLLNASTQDVEEPRTNPWCSMVFIIVESAALYAGTNLVYMVLTAAGHPTQRLLAAWEVPVASATFSLIVIRVHKLAQSAAANSMARTATHVGTFSTTFFGDRQPIPDIVIEPSLRTRPSVTTMSIYSKPSAMISLRDPSTRGPQLTAPVKAEPWTVVNSRPGYI